MVRRRHWDICHSCSCAGCLLHHEVNLRYHLTEGPKKFPLKILHAYDFWKKLIPGKKSWASSTFESRIKNAKNNPKLAADYLHAHKCWLCPLRKEWPHLKHFKLNPHGSDTAPIYFLGEAPGAEETEQGIPFVGVAGQTLRFRVPEEYEPDIRWNNVLRCRPPKNRNPDPIEIEACRPYIIEDIEFAKPVAIFGFGNYPLQWMLGQSGITKWRGRKVPVKIGEHACWFFPMFHPSYINRMEYAAPDEEFVFALDLHRAFEQVYAGLEEPVVHTKEQAMKDVQIVY